MRIAPKDPVGAGSQVLFWPELSSWQIPCRFWGLHQELIPLAWVRVGWRQELRVGPSALALLPQQVWWGWWGHDMWNQPAWVFPLLVRADSKLINWIIEQSCLQVTESCEPEGEKKFKSHVIFGKPITQDFYLALVFGACSAWDFLFNRTRNLLFCLNERWSWELAEEAIAKQTCQFAQENCNTGKEQLKLKNPPHLRTQSCY